MPRAISPVKHTSHATHQRTTPTYDRTPRPSTQAPYTRAVLIPMARTTLEHPSGCTSSHPARALRLGRQTRLQTPTHPYAVATNPCQGLPLRRTHEPTSTSALAAPPAIRERDTKRSNLTRTQKLPRPNPPSTRVRCPPRPWLVPKNRALEPRLPSRRKSDLWVRHGSMPCHYTPFTWAHDPAPCTHTHHPCIEPVANQNNTYMTHACT